jgi:hypothetical protein
LIIFLHGMMQKLMAAHREAHIQLRRGLLML